MAWDEKANVNDILLFCDEWKTREEIGEQFKLTNIESWHCVRFLAKLNHEVTVDKRVGVTKRAYRYKTRVCTIQKIHNEMEKKEIVPEPVQSPKNLESTEEEKDEQFF